MAINFSDKLERLCHAASTDSKSGLSMTFGHATDNISMAAEAAVERQVESARPSIFRTPR